MTAEGHRWDSHDYIQGWLARVEGQTLDNIKRGEQFNMAVDLIPFEHDDSFRVLDVGAGWGALLNAILEAFPRATGVSLDSSQEMLSLGRSRLAKLGGRVSFAVGDMDDPGWSSAVEGQFSVIVSSRAIHHLTAERKQAIYREIYARLNSGGCFINVDHVLAPDPYLRDVFKRVRLAEVHRMARSMGLEKPTEEMLAGVQGARSVTEQHSLLTDQLRWLEEAGFQAVDVFWKYLGTAVFGGFKLG